MATADEIRERKRIVMAKWRAANPDRDKANNKKWGDSNPEKRKESVAKWREKNKQKHQLYQKQYQANNLERYRIHAQNRRCLLRLGSLSQGLMSKLMKLQKSKCACCRISLTNTKIHLDHIMPIALGGEHTDFNIQLLCQTCNQQKHAKHPIEFMQSKGMLL